MSLFLWNNLYQCVSWGKGVLDIVEQSCRRGFAWKVRVAKGPPLSFTNSGTICVLFVVACPPYAFLQFCCFTEPHCLMWVQIKGGRSTQPVKGITGPTLQQGCAVTLIHHVLWNQFQIPEQKKHVVIQETASIALPIYANSIGTVL